MTFEIDIGGHRRVLTVEAVDSGGAGGGHFRVVVRAVAAEDQFAAVPSSAGDVIDVDVRRTDLGLSVIDRATGRVLDAALTDRGAGQWLIQFPRATLLASVDGRLRGSQGHAAAASAAQRVTAPMPGRVVRVLVHPDDEVAAGQGLIVIEAMKMENELRAGRAGRVREVTVTAGAAVEAGRLLVVID
jgi:acetyl/propionyl-CoA carboxylase alpha subunit